MKTVLQCLGVGLVLAFAYVGFSAFVAQLAHLYFQHMASICHR